MTQNKAILVATVGTRDLAFYTESENKWLNIGNAYSSTLEESHLVKIQYDLKIEDDNANFRNITKHLSENYDQYQAKLKPIIIGKLIEDKKDIIKTVYLVVTNQEGIAEDKFCQKDTLYSGAIIKKYLEANYNFKVNIFYQGNEEKSNPANFEEMFRWWQDFWKVITPGINQETDLFLCLKGGVNQSSEAARITSIIEFEENVIFYDFEEIETDNLKGKPSSYTKPFRGVNYLWNRKQTEALSLLDRFDYEAVNSILQKYYHQNSNNEDIRKIKLWLSKAIKWNITDFDAFINGLQQIPDNNWWWKGYESAYLGLVRLKQGNNIEAFFHVFRGIEGLMSELIINKYNSHVEIPKGETPYLKSSICRDNQHPELRNCQNQFNDGKVYLYGSGLKFLVEIALPEIKNDSLWKRFFSQIKPWRNRTYHRFKHLTRKDLLNVCWEVKNEEEWINKILYFLNSLSKQNYSSLKKASLMAEYHDKIRNLILTYYPSQ